MDRQMLNRTTQGRTSNGQSGIDRLFDEMERQIIEASNEEILEEARAEGRDPAEFGTRMREFIRKTRNEIESGKEFKTLPFR